MQALDLNLASRPFRNNTLLWVANLLALVLLAAFSWWNVETYTSHLVLLKDLRAQVESIESQFADLDRRDRITRQEIGKYDVKALTVKTEKANSVIRWKAFSWTELFNLMERIQPNDVRMTAVRPVFRSERDPLSRTAEAASSNAVPVSVEGLAKDLQAFFELENALMRDPHFDRVEPGRIAKTENTGETMFELSFLYDPKQSSPSAAAADGAAGAPEEAPEPPAAGEEPAALAVGADRVEQGAREAVEAEPTPGVDPASRGSRGKRRGR